MARLPLWLTTLRLLLLVVFSETVEIHCPLAEEGKSQALICSATPEENVSRIIWDISTSDFEQPVQCSGTDYPEQCQDYSVMVYKTDAVFLSVLLIENVTAALRNANFTCTGSSHSFTFADANVASCVLEVYHMPNFFACNTIWSEDTKTEVGCEIRSVYPNISCTFQQADKRVTGEQPDISYKTVTTLIDGAEYFDTNCSLPFSANDTSVYVYISDAYFVNLNVTVLENYAVTKGADTKEVSVLNSNVTAQENCSTCNSTDIKDEEATRTEVFHYLSFNVLVFCPLGLVCLITAVTLSLLYYRRMKTSEDFPPKDEDPAHSVAEGGTSLCFSDGDEVEKENDSSVRRSLSKLYERVLSKKPPKPPKPARKKNSHGVFVELKVHGVLPRAYSYSDDDMSHSTTFSDGSIDDTVTYFSSPYAICDIQHGIDDTSEEHYG